MCASCTCRIIYACNAHRGFISKWYYTCWIMGCKCCVWLPCWPAGPWPQLEWPKAVRIKKKGIYWVKCLNVGLWTLVSCPRLSHNQLCVLIVPLALLGSDWSISRLHVKFLLTLSGSWRYQLFSPASLVASKASQAPAGAAITTTTTIVCPPKGALCYLIHSGQMPFTDKSPQHLTVYVHIFNLLHHHLSWFNCSFFLENCMKLCITRYCKCILLNAKKGLILFLD